MGYLEDTQGISITSADEPEAIVLDLEGPLQPGRRAIGQGRTTRLDEAGRAASERYRALTHWRLITVARALCESNGKSNHRASGHSPTPSHPGRIISGAGRPHSLRPFFARGHCCSAVNCLNKRFASAMRLIS